MKKFSGPFLFILILGIIIYYIFISVRASLVPDADNKVIINNKVINVEIAKTAEQHIHGLQNREYLEANSGILFVFPDKLKRSFWMKDMKFPLDIIWILGSQIVGIEANVPAPVKDQLNLPTYTSPEEVDYVLEVNAGFAEKHNFNKGDEVKIDIK